MEDKRILCRDCGQEFIFSVSEQEFYKEKGFENDPVRCKNCRNSRKANRAGSGPRQMYPVTCAECGKQTEVPFRPTGEKPVYCRDCFNKSKQG